MTNTNCLEGVRCPVCGNEAEFLISTHSVATITDEGVDDATDHEWDDNSYTRCPECDEDGELSEFRGQGLDAGKALRHVLRTLTRVYPHLLDGKMLPHDAAMFRRLLDILTIETTGKEIVQ
jgi:hypothetical protein